MLKLSKKTEYALMAARYLAMNNSGHYSTAKEISENYQIPQQLVAKVLQNFVRSNLASSFQGVKGGYQLQRPPQNITLIDIIRSVEDNFKLTECMNEELNNNNCSHLDCCKIRNPLIDIQNKIDKLFENTTLNQIL